MWGREVSIVVAVSCLLFTCDIAVGQWVQWTTGEGGNGHWYRLTSEALSWHEAEAEAVAAGGHLVTINDAAENQWLVATFGGSGLTEAWTGFTDSQVESE